MRRLSLLWFLFFLGCSPNGIKPPITTVIKAAPRAVLVDEPAERARASTAEAGRSATVIATQANNLLSKNRKLHLELGEAVAHADRLRKLDERSQAEMDLLWKRLTEIHLRYEDSLKEAEVLQAEIGRLTGLTRSAEQQVAELHKAAVGKQAEAAENARLLGLAESLRREDSGKLQNALDELVKERTARAKLEGRIKLYDTIAIILGGVTTIYLLIRFVGPLLFPGFFAARAAQKVIVH